MLLLILFSILSLKLSSMRLPLLLRKLVDLLSGFVGACTTILGYFALIDCWVVPVRCRFRENAECLRGLASEFDKMDS